MGNNIGWDETTPSDTESVSLGDDRIRSLKTSLRQGLSAEHAWPSGGGDSGTHLLGSARPYVGIQSAVSSSGTDGRLMMTSDSSRLFGVGSGGTTYLGGPTVISMPLGNISYPQRSMWQLECGTGVTGSGGSATVTLPNSGFSGAPYLWVSGYTTVSGSGRFPAWGINDITATSFTVWAWDATFSLSQGSVPFFWQSIGTRTL